MRAFVITLFNDQYSLNGSRTCIATARQMNDDLQIEMVKATVPGETVNWEYTYPLQGEIKESHGMTLTGYRASNHRKIMACSLSHLKLWDKCVEMDQPVLVLEHDVVFTRRFRINKILNNITDGDIVMINDPRGATRRSGQYHENIIKWDFGINPIQGVNLPEENAPDGLAGNSAYVITPKAARQAAELQRKIGLWPNDALLCKQLFPRQLKSYYPYITKTVQTKSTTTG